MSIPTKVEVATVLCLGVVTINETKSVQSELATAHTQLVIDIHKISTKDYNDIIATLSMIHY